MQKENYNDIDSKLKSMLENAEIKPSSDVWKGIASRLDTTPAAASGRISRVWGLALAGISAAVAGVLIFTSIGNSNRLYISEDAVALTQKPETTAQPLSEIQGLLAMVEDNGIQATPEQPASTLLYARETEEPASANHSGVQPGDSGIQSGDSVHPNGDVQSGDGIRSDSEIHSDRGVRSGNSVHSSNEINPLAGIKEDTASETGPVRFSAKGSMGENIGTGAIMNRPMKASGLHSAAKPETGIYESGASTYGAPVTFGIGLDIPISKVFSIGTGLDYSLLTRSFNGVFTRVDADGVTDIEGDVLHRMHYIGIPLDFNFSIYRNNFINVYAFIGGEVEYCISNSYTIRGGMSDVLYHENVKGLLFSTQAGAGIEAKLNDHLGLFLAPAVHYYFPGNQPKSIRTEKQLMIGASMGLRFDL